MLDLNRMLDYQWKVMIDLNQIYDCEDYQKKLFNCEDSNMVHLYFYFGLN